MAHIKLKDVINRVQTKVDKDNTSLIYYVGGEHIESENVCITKRGLIEGSTIGPMFYYGFKAGDFLLVSRNPHLKKAGVVGFDGICSEKTFVLATANSEVLLPEYLPFILQNDTFWEYAYQHRHGSTNTFINWSTLANYEFELPNIEIQRKLAEILWAINDTMESYKRLILATDELVKSQFIEMIEPYSQYSTKAGTIMYGMRNGLSPSRAGEHYAKTLTLSAVTQGVFDENAWKDGYFADCPPNDKRICATDFYICRGNGNKTLVGAGVYSLEDRFDLVFPDTVIAARINEQKIRLPYLYMAWKMQAVRNQIEENAKTTNGTYKINQSVIANVELVVPPLPVQDEFVAFVQQSDKSKFELEQALSELTATYKRIISEQLG
ncbi:restriction endonuclease subunit S [Oscillibacter sp.]|uniref:restriction endonuclease subunit S n=1 Tax=Oscillibacter sp. TaxID=1945593 RepID=UPI00258B25F4|nr:restriction endonuclease subunit S [Oscillibacter sp.]